MKTIKECEAEIATLTSFIENNYKNIGNNDKKDSSKKDLSKMFAKEKSRIAFLRHVIMYLETNPSESYIRLECERLDKLIESLEGQFETWTKNTPPDAPPEKFKAIFNKEMGLVLLRLQRKTAYFILNN